LIRPYNGSLLRGGPGGTEAGPGTRRGWLPRRRAGRAPPGRRRRPRSAPARRPRARRSARPRPRALRKRSSAPVRERPRSAGAGAGAGAVPARGARRSGAARARVASMRPVRDATMRRCDPCAGARGGGGAGGGTERSSGARWSAAASSGRRRSAMAACAAVSPAARSTLLSTMASCPVRDQPPPARERPGGQPEIKSRAPLRMQSGRRSAFDLFKRLV